MDEYTDFWQVTGEGLDYALAAHEIDNPAIRQALMDLYLTLDAYPDALATLQQLKDAGYATGILSNGSPDMLAAAVKNSGLAPLMDEVMSVQDVGIFKPSARVYQLAVDRMGVSPQEICFVSANSWDASGAADFGFQVAHLNRFGQPAEKLPGVPKTVMNSLSDLPAVLN